MEFSLCGAHMNLPSKFLDLVLALCKQKAQKDTVNIGQREKGKEGREEMKGREPGREIKETEG